jgi:hypothetical protein
MTTIIQIGNSDDKLTQSQWSLFYHRVDNAIRTRALCVHFCGASYPSAEWQNAAWIFEIDAIPSIELQKYMKSLCEWFDQESIAWTEGETILVSAHGVEKDGA